MGRQLVSWTLGMVMSVIAYSVGKWKKKMYASHAERTLNE